ncbi:glycosyltransferase [Hydrogenimonas cancrithermarum]|nr:glycosyltransferase [Hydrogenimonas cancrithermarum]
MNLNLSVLLSIYHKEKPEYFDRAMQSIWDEQSIKPNQIVLVKDGPLTQELEDAISYWKEKLKGVLDIITLEENVGLGDALNIGLQQCKYDLVARMDTDDISTSDRFKEQLAVFEKKDIDICSSWVAEFDKDESTTVSFRKVPESDEEIRHFAKKRNPLNHPAVMYRKSKVVEAGGYQKMMWFEDYYLWSKMILHGAKFYNIQEPLVHMRAGYGQLERRSGMKYALSEIEFQKKLLNMGFIDKGEFIRNVSLRFISRILPKRLVKIIYTKLRT